MAKKSNFNWFGKTDIAENSDKKWYVYSGYGISFYISSSWSLDNDPAGNAVIFSIDNSSPSHAENCKNNFFVSGEVPTFGINGSFWFIIVKVQ